MRLKIVGSAIIIVLLAGCASSQGVDELLYGQATPGAQYPLLGEQAAQPQTELISNSQQQNLKRDLQATAAQQASEASAAQGTPQSRSGALAEMQSLRDNHANEALKTIEKRR